MAILKQHTIFVGYNLIRKISNHHDGEREIYLVEDSEGDKVALVVYDLSRDLDCKEAKEKLEANFNEEIKICSSLKNICFPKIIGFGIENIGNERIGWIAQKYIEGKCLSEIMAENKDPIPLADTLGIVKQLTIALRELSENRKGGGHYNICPDNITVDYDNDELKGVYIVGMSNAGMSIHGNPPFKDDHLSNLYRAPETLNGIYNQVSDVYSIGMLLLVMMLGCKVYDQHGYGCIMPSPEVMNDENTKRHTQMEPADWNKSVWDCVGESFSTTTRLVLQKATTISAGTRIPTMAKLYTYLLMLEKRDIKSTTIRESSLIPPLKGFQSAVSTKGLGAKGSADETMCTSSQIPKGNGLDDVAGMADLKSVLRRNFVDIVKNRQMAKMYGITPPNGILLYGAPGCGKTFVAEKAAQESGLKYKIVHPSDFGSIYIHGSQGKIAEAFKEAEKNAPMILIFDEFDAIAPKRDADNNNQANEVNEILTQMNNCAARGIYVLATTNRPEMIDSACLRAGRMDEKFYVGLPDAVARKEIFALELKKRPCDSDIDLELLGNATNDYTCGDISYIVKETARRCFNEALRNGDGNTVPLTTDRLLEVVKSTIPSVSPKDIRLYQELKDKMEHRYKENKLRGRVGFSMCS